MKMIAIAAFGALAVGVPGAASATIMVYDIVGSGHHAVFTLPLNPTNFAFEDDGADFATTTTGTFDGVADIVGVTFYANPYPDPTVPAGGMSYVHDNVAFTWDFAGPQLYSGPEATPKLLAFGPLILTDLTTGEQLTISATEAVPEPATWATMVIGFGVVGGAYRARRGKVAFA